MFSFSLIFRQKYPLQAKVKLTVSEQFDNGYSYSYYSLGSELGQSTAKLQNIWTCAD